MTNYKQTIDSKIISTLQIGHAVFKTDDYTILEHNNEFQKLLHLKSSAIGLSLDKLLHLPVNFSDLLKICKGEKLIECLVKPVDDNQEITLHFKAELLDEHGDKALMIFVPINEFITKRKNVEELKDMLIESAFEQGIAQNATMVLHNIGNILTIIQNKVSSPKPLENILLSLTILERLKTTLDKDHNDLLDFFKDQKQTQQMKSLLDGLSNKLGENAKLLRDDLANVKSKIKHISDIIHAQQKYANLKDRSKTTIYVEDVLRDSITIHEDRLARRGIKLNRTISSGLSVYMDRIGLAQTLSNLIVNAVEATDERSQNDPLYTDKEITISAQKDNENVVIIVADNGIGFSKTNQERLFNFGFSTKDRGSGFGLHDSANFLRANSSTISLDSEGAGKGTKVTIIIPIEKSRN